MMYRSTFPMGGGTDGNRQQLYEALMQKGALGEMSYEEFAQIPPQQLRQMLQQMQGQMQGAQQMSHGGRPSYQGDLTDEDREAVVGISDAFGQTTSNPESAKWLEDEEQRKEDLVNKRAEKRANTDYAGILAGAGQASGLATGLAGSAISSGDTTGGDYSGTKVGGNLLSAAGEGFTQGGLFGGIASTGLAAVDMLAGADARGKAAARDQEGANIGTTGTRLNPEVAANTIAQYGLRTPGMAERNMVNKMRMRANTPGYVGMNNSPMGRAGYQIGGRPTYQGTGTQTPGQKYRGNVVRKGPTIRTNERQFWNPDGPSYPMEAPPSNTIDSIKENYNIGPRTGNPPPMKPNYEIYKPGSFGGYKGRYSEFQKEQRGLRDALTARNLTKRNQYTDDVGRYNTLVGDANDLAGIQQTLMGAQDTRPKAPRETHNDYMYRTGGFRGAKGLAYGGRPMYQGVQGGAGGVSNRTAPANIPSPYPDTSAGMARLGYTQNPNSTYQIPRGSTQSQASKIAAWNRQRLAEQRGLQADLSQPDLPSIDFDLGAEGQYREKLPIKQYGGSNRFYNPYMAYGGGYGKKY